MQLFLAIDIPDEIKKQLKLDLTELHDEYRVFRWVQQDHFHITLQYYGENDIDRYIEKVEEAIIDFPPFEIETEKGGVFMRHEVTLFYRMRLTNTFSRFIKSLDHHVGYSRHGMFIPHITFARTRIPSKQQYLLIKKKVRAMRPQYEIPVQSISLYNTLQRSDGAEYQKIHTFHLLEDIKI